MKKITLLMCLMVTMFVTAQEKITEGVFVSKSTMTSGNEAMNQQFKMIGDLITTTYFKNLKNRSELNSPITGNVTTITDTKAQEMLMLMDSPMAGKIFSKSSTKIDESTLESMKVEKGDKTKEILGYTCQQYHVSITQNGLEAKMDLYVTDKINVFTKDTQVLRGKVPGTALYMTMSVNQSGMDMTIITEITEIRKEAVADSKFDMTIPEGYKLMTK